MFLSPPCAEQHCASLIRQHSSLSLHPINPWLTAPRPPRHSHLPMAQQHSGDWLGAALAQSLPPKKPVSSCPPERVTWRGEPWGQGGGEGTPAWEQDPRYFLLRTHSPLPSPILTRRCGAEPECPAAAYRVWMNCMEVRGGQSLRAGPQGRRPRGVIWRLEVSLSLCSRCLLPLSGVSDPVISPRPARSFFTGVGREGCCLTPPAGEKALALWSHLLGLKSTL